MTTAQWVEVFVAFSVQVTVIVATSKLLERLIGGNSERCILWTRSFQCILLLACTAVFLPRLHLVQLWTELEPQTRMSLNTTEVILGRLLISIWLVGVAVLLVRWAIRSQIARRALRRCKPLAPSQLDQLFKDIICDVAVSDLPRILVSDDAVGPFCWQLHTPTVVLPHFLLSGDPADLRNVLLHEMEHLKTQHPLQLFLQRLTEVICWFHPAVWYAGARASLIREFACDEVAAQYGTNSATYLRTLLRIAERSEQNRLLSTIGFGKVPSQIVSRARHLAELATSPRTPADKAGLRRLSAVFVLLAIAVSVRFISIPTDPLASSRSRWSPWPTWTAKSLNCFDLQVRDYEQYDPRSQLFEIVRTANPQESRCPIRQ